MLTIPTVVGTEVSSTAERRVHAALAHCDLGGVALHSLNLPEHAYKIMSELDFVVILEDLILVVEVKGGSIARRNGEWIYRDRYGRGRTTTEGPFKQAISGKFALRDLLADRLPDSELRTVAFGYLVITPDVDLPPSVEWPPEAYLGQRQFNRPDGLKVALERAGRYWRAKQRFARTINAAHRERLSRALRPDFDQVPNLLAHAHQLDEVYARLTADQADQLDMMLENPRILCKGGAGTGKTFVAVEVARRAATEGLQVLLCCRSPVLAAFLRNRLANVPVDVLPLDRVLGEGKERYDFVVVDEAQDVMNLESLEPVEEVLDGGLSHGRWMILLDPNRQAADSDGFDSTTLALLAERAASATLRRNCRNTKQITFQTRAHTGADLDIEAVGEGPPVTWVTSTDPADETRRLETWVRSLRAQGVPDGEITVVSLRNDFDASSASGLRDAKRGKIQRLDEFTAGRWPVNEITWASARDIKGLENRFICVVDVDSLDDKADLDRLYVAMTRARASLWISLRPPAQAAVKRLLETHASSALDALKD